MTHLETAAAEYAQARTAAHKAKQERIAFVKKFKKQFGYLYVGDDDFDAHGVLETKQALDKKIFTLKKAAVAAEEALQSAAMKFDFYS